MMHIITEHYERRIFNTHVYLLLFTGILVITCGKQGAFFTAVMLVLMYRINTYQRIYKILVRVGLLFVAISVVYSINDAHTNLRYINGVWQEITKRSNILYVSYMAVTCFYLLVHRSDVNKKKLFMLAIVGYAMFIYSGSRSGFVMLAFLLLLILSFRSRILRNNSLVRYLCVYSPLYCMLFCVYTGWGYGKHAWLSYLDLVMQGRIEQNCIFMGRYAILPFGQHIIEGGDVKGEFLNLDCAYLDMLLCEGVLFSILWVLSTIAVIRYFYNGKRMVEVSILVMYAFYGISETFLPNCFLNVSLFLYGEYLYRTRRVGTLN